MKTLTIGFSASTKKLALFCWAIKWFQKTPYSHVYIRWDSVNLNRTIVYQASSMAVNFIEYSNFLKKNEVIKEYTIQITEEQYKKILQFAMDKVGEPYSTKQIINMVIYRIFSVKVFKETSGYVCSELIAQIMEEDLGYKFNQGLDFILPKDVEAILAS